MKNNDRFIKVYEQGIMRGFEIWADRETSVAYLKTEIGAITPLLQADGKPFVFSKEEIESHV